jgi:osmotically-inducible protein OsmY
MSTQRLPVAAFLCALALLLVAGCGQPAADSGLAPAALGVEAAKTVADKAEPKQGAASPPVSDVDDGIITAKVESALLSNPGVNGLDINVVTRRGETRLRGFVDTPSQIEQATGIARAVEGVVSVSNEMSLKQ